MRVESGIMPQSFRIIRRGGKAFVQFAENVEEKAVEEGKKWEYDSYQIAVRDRGNLESSIELEYDAWLQRAKVEEAKVVGASIEEEIAKLKPRVETIEEAVLELLTLPY